MVDGIQLIYPNLIFSDYYYINDYFNPNHIHSDYQK